MKNLRRRQELEQRLAEVERYLESRRLYKTPKPVDPVRWVERTRILKGQPFSFQDRPFLPPLYRDRARRLIIVKGRQVECTEFLVNWLLQNLLGYPSTTGIYTAPRMDQVSRFSRDRFRKAILDSPALRELITTAREIEGQSAIGRVPFANGSVCYLISAWGDFSAIRNIPADFVAIDEMQDVQSEAIPVIEETMSHSKFRSLVAVGTASDAGSEFDRLWHQSDMKEWDEESQAWIPQKPGQVWSGYHMSQEMVPWIRDLPLDDPDSIEAKRMRYSERRFLNEVLGIFYRGLAKPLLVEDMLLCRDFANGLVNRILPPVDSYAGIDWGGGQFAFTVLWIMAKDDEGRWRLAYVRKFNERDPMKQVQIIGDCLTVFNVKQAVADIGYGAVQVSELQKRLGSRVIGCQYVRRPEIPLERKERDEYGQRIAQMLVLADRSFWIETAISHIKHKDLAGHPTPKLILPWANPQDVEWLIDHFTCIEMEEQETVSGKRYHHYTHPEGQPDDALHAFIYALIAEAIGRMSQPLIPKDLFD